MSVPEIEMYCSECEEFTYHELYDYNDRAEIWDCKCCDKTEIIAK